ncbi:MAG: hypothetical protein H6713_01555 [Myxococcales bacterium]|nr:hypothetical protein [Myxococcales bacterium]
MPAVRPRAWLALALLASACTPTHRPPPAARADDDATPTREPPASDPLDDDAFLALTRAFADQLARDTRVALARPVSTREQAYAVISTLALAHPEQAAAGARVLERHGVRPEQLARYVDAHPERAQFLASEAYAPLDALRPGSPRGAPASRRCRAPRGRPRCGARRGSPRGRRPPARGRPGPDDSSRDRGAQPR